MNTPRKNIPPGLDLQAVLKGMPWLEHWLRPPEEQTQLLAAPRDFVQTPFALTMLNERRDTAPWLHCVMAPWVSLQRTARRILLGHKEWILAKMPLHGYILYDNVEACYILAKRGDARQQGFGADGHTALTLAALLGQDLMVEVLLDQGADLSDCDALGNTALHWACIMRNRPLAGRLLQHGANAEQLNLLGGAPGDYELAWDRGPAEQLAMDVQAADGTRQHFSDAAAFKAHMQFELLPQARPGVDLYMQWIMGMLQPAWVQETRAALQAVQPFDRAEVSEVPLFLKDFGEPFGFGVCTHVDIPAGAPVTGYVGDLVHTFEVTVDLFNCGYTLYSCNSLPSPELQKMFLMHFDGRRSGNLGSRINSSHTAEAATLQHRFRFWRGLPASMMFAKRDIRAGEQVSWFYGDGYWRARGMEAQPLPA